LRIVKIDPSFYPISLKKIIYSTNPSIRMKIVARLNKLINPFYLKPVV
jgi:hypothetical protein